MAKEKKKVICRDIKGKEYKVSASKLTFRPSVYGVIIQANKVLLSKKWDGYDFPGGAVNLGEKLKEALKREVKEETGLEVEVGRIVACEDSFFKLLFKEKFVHSILMYYLCEIIGGDLSCDFLDHNEKEYADMEEAQSLSRLTFSTSVLLATPFSLLSVMSSCS